METVGSYNGLHNDSTSTQRKSSLRNVVRRIFGRAKPKEPEMAMQRPSPPRHKYHRSEPPQLSPPQEQPEYDQYREDTVPHRVLSVPLQLEMPNAMSRVRSPYAVEFPKSARLKPIDLGSPFDTPGSTSILRRTKTMPSVLLASRDAEAGETSIETQNVPPMPTARASHDIARDTPEPDVGIAVDGIRNPKRRSRSVGELRAVDATRPSPPARKRSDEIRFWRESFQGSVLRASGFMVPPPRPATQHEEEAPRSAREEQEESMTPTRQKSGQWFANAPSHSRQDTLGILEGSGSSPPPGARSASALGTDLSHDLEDRVAKLEAHLQSFQQSLTRLQGEKHRRTIVADKLPISRRADKRTPSMLADDLSLPIEVSDYQYAYEPPAAPASSRPSTAPHPMTPNRDREEPPMPPLPVQPPHFSTSTVVDANAAAAATGTRVASQSPSTAHFATTPNVTFRSLYQMLSDERSARRRLEGQMRGLKTELQDLQFQVQTQSRLQSQRNSYMLSHDAAMGSARLQELLRQTEDSPANTPVRDRQSGSGGDGVVVSRFSGSTRQESEAGAARELEVDDDLQTPYEAYQTPKEASSPFHFGRDGDGDMF